MNVTDELRELAGRMDGLVPDTPDMLREAADTIDELREMVRDMFYAVHPVDREKFLINVAELGIEVE